MDGGDCTDPADLGQPSDGLHRISLSLSLSLSLCVCLSVCLFLSFLPSFRHRHRSRSSSADARSERRIAPAVSFLPPAPPPSPLPPPGSFWIHRLTAWEETACALSCRHLNCLILASTIPRPSDIHWKERKKEKVRTEKAPYSLGIEAFDWILAISSVSSYSETDLPLRDLAFPI